MGRKRKLNNDVAGLLGLQGSLATGSSGAGPGAAPSGATFPGATQSTSSLRLVLLESYLWGNISATQVQAIAHAAVQDGLDLPDIVALSRLGTDGQYTGGQKHCSLFPNPKGWSWGIKAATQPLATWRQREERNSVCTPCAQEHNGQHPNVCIYIYMFLFLSPTESCCLDVHLCCDHGLHRGHVARDLETLLGEPILKKAMSDIFLPISMGRQAVCVPHRMLLPHKLWATLFETSPAMFKKFCSIDSDQIQAFWNGMVGTPLHRQATALDRDVSKVVPLKLFGDGVATTGIGKAWGKSADTFLLANVLSGGSSRSSEVCKENIPRGHNKCYFQAVQDFFVLVVRAREAKNLEPPSLEMSFLW